MFFEYFEDVRKRSPEARKAYAVSFASIATGIIVFIWLVTLFLGHGGELLNKNNNDGKDGHTSIKDSTKMFNSSNMFLKDDMEDIKIPKKNNLNYDTYDINQSSASIVANGVSTTSTSSATNTKQK